MTFTLRTARAVRIASAITFLAFVASMVFAWSIFWQAWESGRGSVAIVSAALLGVSLSGAHDMAISFYRSFRMGEADDA